MAETAAQSPRLLDRVREVARLKHFSLKTERSYLFYIRNYLLFHNQRHPREMGVSEIRAYLSHLATEKNVAASTQNVAGSGCVATVNRSARYSVRKPLGWEV